jgi:hypothetical protein
MQAIACMTGVRLVARDVLRYMLEAVERLGMPEPLCNNYGPWRASARRKC